MSSLQDGEQGVNVIRKHDISYNIEYQNNAVTNSASEKNVDHTLFQIINPQSLLDNEFTLQVPKDIKAFWSPVSKKRKYFFEDKQSDATALNEDSLLPDSARMEHTLQYWEVPDSGMIVNYLTL